MIRVYWLDCSQLTDEEELTRVLPYLGKDRTIKTLRLQTAERRAQCAAAGLLLRHLFGDAKYTYGDNGKPYLNDKTNLYFSISHSDRYVVCAVADCEVGVDIEPLSPIRSAVLRRCFTPKEQKWIGDDKNRFMRLWTMKEAYMKLTGTGLSVPAKDIALVIPPAEEKDENNHCFWHFPNFFLPCSICAAENHPCEIIEKSIKDLL